MTTLTATSPTFWGSRARYLTLAAPAPEELAGTFHSAILGPGWYQAFARRMLGFAGLADWRGKRFDAQGNGLNLVGPAFEGVLPMTIRIAPSALDAKPGAVVRYGAAARFPWPYIVDELRVLDSRTWLGVTYVDAPLLRGLIAPFVITRV